MLKESEITSYIGRYDSLLTVLQQIAEFGTNKLEDLNDEIRYFYDETFVIIERLTDLKSLPLEELRVKKLLVDEWFEIAQKRTYMPKQHFETISRIAMEENGGSIPPAFASGDRKSGTMEQVYQTCVSVNWHYNYFITGVEKVLAFLTEATKPYQNAKSLDNLQKDYNKEVGNMLKEYLTTTEAAELLKTSVKTVLRRIEKGQIKATKQGNAPYRIRRLDVELWLAGQK